MPAFATRQRDLVAFDRVSRRGLGLSSFRGNDIQLYRDSAGLREHATEIKIPAILSRESLDINRGL